jgi:hypothetical protein
MLPSLALSLFAMLATSVVANPVPEVLVDLETRAGGDLEKRQTASGCNYLYVKALTLALSRNRMTNLAIALPSAAPRCCVPTVCQCANGMITSPFLRTPSSYVGLTNDSFHRLDLPDQPGQREPRAPRLRPPVGLHRHVQRTVPGLLLLRG